MTDRTNIMWNLQIVFFELGALLTFNENKRMQFYYHRRIIV